MVVVIFVRERIGVNERGGQARDRMQEAVLSVLGHAVGCNHR
jgi:hypothetical protein